MVQDNITRYVNNINELLVSHEEMVKLDAHGNLLSRAVLSEIFYCDFLNVLMGWKLINANIERKNAPGIDLIDETRRVAVQISLMCDHNKIQSSIDKFDKNWSKGSSGWHFYFVPLSDRVPDYKVDFDVPAGIAFDKNTDVLTKARVMALAMIPLQGEKKVDRLRSVSDILDRLMREQEDHDRVCNYLFNVLEKKRASHPSFTLLGDDDIDRKLFPDIENSKDRIFMPTVGDKNGAVAPIWDLITEEQKEGFRHIMMEGTGGIGKSVSLLSVTDKKELLERIPAIYVHMYDLVCDGKCSTISEHIHQYYADPAKIQHLASKGGKPKLMILLDGLNEVAYELQSKLMMSIGRWAESNPGAQLIIASRPIPGKQLEYMLGSEVCFIRLKPLDWGHVKQYLESRHIPVPEEKKPRLRETIRLPLFLTLYSKTAKLDKETAFEKCPLHVKEAVGPASLIWNYLQREVLRQQTESDVITCVFSCELIAPYIAYHMATKHMFEIGWELADKLVSEAVRSMDQNRLPGHVSAAFMWFKRLTHSQSLPSGVNWPIRILNECGIFVPPKKKREGAAGDCERPAADYAFMHQNFRDCLAALHLVNTAETAGRELPKAWERYIRPDVLAYVAELMEKNTAAKLWELNRNYARHSGKRPKNNASTYMQLELNCLLGTTGDQLDFSGMDLRGMSLSGYIESGNDLGLFIKPELSQKTYIDRKVFEHAGHTGSINCLAVLPDGRIVSGSCDNTIRIWSPDTGDCLRTLKGHTKQVSCVAVLPDGRIVSGSYDNYIRIWNADTGECLQTLEGHTLWVKCVTALPDGRIVSGSCDRTLRIWDPDTGKCLGTLEGHDRSITCLAVLSNSRIISGSRDKTIRIWRTDTGKCLRTLEGHADQIDCVTVLPGGSIVSGSIDGTIRIWDLNTGKSLRKHNDWISCRAVLPDGRIASDSDDWSILIWNLDTGEYLQTLEGHIDLVRCLAVLPDGRITSGSDDGTIRVWDPGTGECLRTLEVHTNLITFFAVLPNQRIVTSLADRTLRIWNPATSECLSILKGHTGNVNCLAMLPDGRIASGSDDRTLRIWDPDTGECLLILKGHTDNVNCLVMLSDGRIASSSDDRTLRIWDPNAGECLRTLIGHGNKVDYLAALPDRRIVTGSRDGTIRILNPDTGECLRTLKANSYLIRCLAVLPNGNIASDSFDGIRIWNPDTGECLRALENHVSYLTTLPDGSIVGDSFDGIRIIDPNTGECLRTLKTQTSLASIAALSDGRIVGGSNNGTLHIWNTDTEKCLRKLEGHTGSVKCLAILRDDRIVSQSDDNTLRIWDPNTGECLDVLEATEVDVSHMHLSNAIMDDDTIRILYQNMAKDHMAFEEKYKGLHDKRSVSRFLASLARFFGLRRWGRNRL